MIILTQIYDQSCRFYAIVFCIFRLEDTKKQDRTSLKFWPKLYYFFVAPDRHVAGICYRVLDGCAVQHRKEAQRHCADCLRDGAILLSTSLVNT